MNQNQTESKPADAEQESGKGLDGTPCSAVLPIALRVSNLARNLGLRESMARLGQSPKRPNCDGLELVSQRIHELGWEESERLLLAESGSLPNA